LTFVFLALFCFNFLLFYTFPYFFLLQAIIASGTKKNNFLSGEIQSQLKNKNVTVDVIANSESNVRKFFVVVDFFSALIAHAILYLV